nr:hypothetical protein [Tanacetum cinerariifolium]
MLHVLRVELFINSPWMLSKNWLVQKQTYFGKDTSNPLIVDSLLKTIWFSIHHHLTIEVLAIPGQMATVKRSGDATRLQALVDKKKIVISKAVIRNVDSNSKFYMYPRLGKVSRGVETPLFESMFVVRDVAEEAEAQVPAQGDNVQEPIAEEVVPDVVPPTPTPPSPPSLVIPSSPPHQLPCPPEPQDAEGSSLLFQRVLDTCSALAFRVEGLENDKAAQQLEIVKLKARVKKLEKINKVKSSKLRQLKKVETSQRVESSDDMENVFNQGRIIVDMDQDEGIELVADQEKNAKFEGRHADKQAEIYNIDLDHSVLSMQEDDTEVAAASTPIPAAKPRILTITVAPAVSTKRRKGVVIRDPEEELPSDTPAETPKEEINKEHEESYKNIDWNAALDHVQSKEPQYIKRYHGMKKKPQTESEAPKFDANMRFLFKSKDEMEAEDEEIIKSINETLAQKAAKRRKLSEEAQETKDLRKRLEIVQDEDDGVFVEATPLAQKVPVVDYLIVVIDNKPRSSALWKIVRDRFSTSKPTNFSDEYLLLTLKTMFEEPDGQDAIWRNQKSVHGLALLKRWKLLTSCGVHVITLSTVQLFLLVERRYPLSRFTLEQLVNMARLQVEEEKLMLPSESKDCQSNIDVARLKLNLFKNITAAEEMSKAKDPFSKGPSQVVHPSPIRYLSTSLVLSGQPGKEIPMPLGYKATMNRWRAAHFHQSYHPHLETKICMARDLMRQIKKQEDKMTENASNKRKWEGTYGGSSSQQQNKDPKVIRTHTAGPSNKKGYAGNLPLDCKTSVLRAKQRPSVAKQKAKVICHDYGMLGHYKSDCPIWRCQNCVKEYWKEKTHGDSSVVANNVDV